MAGLCVFNGVENLVRALPCGFESFAFITGAIKRRRVVGWARDMMLVSLYHLMNDCSLKDACAAFCDAGFGQLSAVSLLHRFEKCLPWFEWVNERLMKSSDGLCFHRPEWLADKRVLAADASNVVIAGKQPQTRRLHCLFDIFQMRVVQYEITEKKDKSLCTSGDRQSSATHGETLRNFTPCAGDLFIGDRVYSTCNSMLHCLKNKADFLLRVRKSHSKIYDGKGRDIDLPAMLKKLKKNRCLDIQVYAIGDNGERIPHRICAMHQTPEGMDATNRRDKQTEHKQGAELRPETKEFHKYIVVASSLAQTVSAAQILDLYRLRWQLEIFFKHLKTQLKFDKVPKRRKEGIRAWLAGKIMIALLLTKIKSQAKLSP